MSTPIAFGIQMPAFGVTAFHYVGARAPTQKDRCSDAPTPRASRGKAANRLCYWVIPIHLQEKYKTTITPLF